MECRREAPLHLAEDLFEQAADLGGRLRMDQRAEFGDLRVPGGQRERGRQHRIEQLLDVRRGAGSGLEGIESFEAFGIHRRHPAREDRAQQLALRAEVVVGRRDVDAGLAGHRAQGGGRKAGGGKAALGRIEEPIPCVLARVQHVIETIA
ncbi:MAG: hypothetical protein M5U32_07030 [Myxococcota bacterium]|nr:hypothetical protein [Myxococcota bacterium]